MEANRNPVKEGHNKEIEEIDRAIGFYTNMEKVCICTDPVKTKDITDQLNFLKTIVLLSMDACNNDSAKALSVLKKAERLFEGLPLIALENNDKDWTPSDAEIPGTMIYQHRYRRALMKVVTTEYDKMVTKYIDTDMIQCVDMEDPSKYSNGPALPPISVGILSEYISRKYLFSGEHPFPYFPTNKFRAYYYHPQNTNDLVRVIRLLHPSGSLLPFDQLLKYDQNRGMWIGIDKIGDEDNE